MISAVWTEVMLIRMDVWAHLEIIKRKIEPNVGRSEVSKSDHFEPLRLGLCLCRLLAGEDGLELKGLLPATEHRETSRARSSDLKKTGAMQTARL